jgi:hypothetical protein
VEETTVEIILAPSWVLTTEHAACSSGQPLLVDRSTGDAYGPDDIVQPYNTWNVIPAAEAVVRLAETQALNAEAQALVSRFVTRLSPR